MKNIAKILFLILAIGALVYVVYRIGLEEILSTLPGALKPDIFLFLVIYYFSTVLKGIRWRMLIMKNISLWEAFRHVYVANFFNYASPVRMGELWRINECRKYGIGAAASATIVERVLDVVAVLFMGGAFLSSISSGIASQAVRSIWASFIMIIAAAAALKILKYKKTWSFVGRFLHVGSDDHESAQRLMDEKKILLKSFILTIMIWIMNVVYFWIIANLIAPVALAVSGAIWLSAVLLGSPFITSVGVTHILLIIGMLSLELSYVDAAAIGILAGALTCWIHIVIGYIVYLKK